MSSSQFRILWLKDRSLTSLLFSLGKAFGIHDLGPTHFSLRLELHLPPRGHIPSQSCYIYCILEKFNFRLAKPIATSYTATSTSILFPIPNQSTHIISFQRSFVSHYHLSWYYICHQSTMSTHARTIFHQLNPSQTCQRNKFLICYSLTALVILSKVLIFAPWAIIFSLCDHFSSLISTKSKPSSQGRAQRHNTKLGQTMLLKTSKSSPNSWHCISRILFLSHYGAIILGLASNDTQFIPVITWLLIQNKA